LCKEVMGDSPALQSYQQAASTAALKRMLDTTRLPDAPSASSVAYAKASHTSWMSKFVDVVLPPEVLAACKPLHCELCKASMNSPAMTKSHYEGKGHEKKVRAVLATKGQGSASTANTHYRGVKCDPGSVQPQPPGKFGFCEPCGVGLTSQIQAEQHYQGKSHQKRVNGLKSGQMKEGDYNGWQLQHSGNWDRQAASDNTSPTKPPVTDGPLSCSLCSINVNHPAQLDIHLDGKAHKRKLKQAEEGVPPSVPSKKAKKSSSAECDPELSIYRTPSGDFYCSPCNLSVNSENQFKQHVNSKKHKQKESCNQNVPGAMSSTKRPVETRGPLIAESIRKY